MPSRKRSLPVTLIGAGRVGSTLVRLLHQKGYPIASVVSRTLRSARSLARTVHCQRASDQLSAIDPRTGLIIIATPEGAIDETAVKLSQLGSLRFENITVIHTSGAVTSDALSPLSRSGARLFSLHPIQTFPAARPAGLQMKSMKGVWYGFEGPQSARPFARGLVKDLEGRFIEVPKDRKNLYHVACVFASNYPTVLLAALENVRDALGFQKLDPFEKLLESSIGNARELGPTDALTGPLVRSSLEVLQRHVETLGGLDKELLRVYTALGTYGISMLRSRGRISEEEARRMRQILRNA